MKMPTGPKGSIQALVQAWQIRKREVLIQDKAAKYLRDAISEVVDAGGVPDDKGNLWYEVDPPVIGYDTNGQEVKISRLKRQKAVPQPVMDTDVAIDILTEKGLLKEAADFWIKVIDPEAAIKFLQIAMSGIIPEIPETRIEIIEDKVDELFFLEKLDKDLLNEIFIVGAPTWSLRTQ
jgi:hypothetical protein